MSGGMDGCFQNLVKGIQREGRGRENEATDLVGNVEVHFVLHGWSGLAAGWAALTRQPTTSWKFVL